MHKKSIYVLFSAIFFIQCLDARPPHHSKSSSSKSYSQGGQNSQTSSSNQKTPVSTQLPASYKGEVNKFPITFRVDEKHMGQMTSFENSTIKVLFYDENFEKFEPNPPQPILVMTGKKGATSFEVPAKSVPVVKFKKGDKTGRFGIVGEGGRYVAKKDVISEDGNFILCELDALGTSYLHVIPDNNMISTISSSPLGFGGDNEAYSFDVTVTPRK